MYIDNIDASFHLAKTNSGSMFLRRNGKVFDFKFIPFIIPTCYMYIYIYIYINELWPQYTEDTAIPRLSRLIKTFSCGTLETKSSVKIIFILESIFM